MVADLPDGTGDDEQDQDGTANTRDGNPTTSSRIPRPCPYGKSKRPSATSEPDIVEDVEGRHHAVRDQERDKGCRADEGKAECEAGQERAEVG